MSNLAQIGLVAVALVGAGVGAIVMAWYMRVGPRGAAGFGGRQPRESWPHGVQEEDDVQWNWRTPRADASQVPQIDEPTEATATDRVRGRTRR